MATKALDLFQAYAENKLPKEGGYIISSFFQEASVYAKYEVVAYSGVKALYLSEDGLTFQTDGNKLFILSEPMSYASKPVEPFRRDTQHQIPHRFSELEIITAKNQTRVMVSKEPVLTYSAFTIMKPKGINFAFIFYNLPDVIDSISHFFERTLHQEAGIPSSDGAKAAKKIVQVLKNFSVWSE